MRTEELVESGGKSFITWSEIKANTTTEKDKEAIIVKIPLENESRAQEPHSPRCGLGKTWKKQAVKVTGGFPGEMVWNNATAGKRKIDRGERPAGGHPVYREGYSEKLKGEAAWCPHEAKARNRM